MSTNLLAESERTKYAKGGRIVLYVTIKNESEWWEHLENVVKNNGGIEEVFNFDVEYEYEFSPRDSKTHS